MENTQIPWLVELPNEILIEILDNLNRAQLTRIIMVNKRIHALAQYLIEHKKKIRFCGDHLRVLVLSLPSAYEEVQDPKPCARRGLVPYYMNPNVRERYLVHYKNSQDRPVPLNCKLFNGGKERKITMILGPNEKHLRQRLWITAVAADMCVFVVDPDEIDSHAEDIKEMIFGTCFMMSARNIIVVVDMRRFQPNELLQVFNQSRTKMAKLLDRTVGLCYKIIPANLQTGVNISDPKYEWFSGPMLKQLLMEDQLRTNFDEIAYKRLCDEPLRIQLHACHKIGGIGTVPEGHVISGTLNPQDIVRFHPNSVTSEAKTLETYHDPITVAQPGDFIGFSIRMVSVRDIFQRFCYAVKLKQVTSVNCTIAFRASLVVMKPDRFTQHQTYTVFYGASRIRCVLWWIFPEDGKKDAKRESANVSLEKPDKTLLTSKDYKWEMRVYREALKKAWLDKKVTNFERPPKKKLRKATAILLPLVYYDIEPYKPTEFEKNLVGKVMLTEKGSIVSVGRVDRIINNSADTFKLPTIKDYRDQYDKVMSSASLLFKLPTEQNQLEMFLDHIEHDEHAKNAILSAKPLSPYKACDAGCIMMKQAVLAYERFNVIKKKWRSASTASMTTKLSSPRRRGREYSFVP